MQLSKFRRAAVLLLLCTFALSSVIGIASAEQPYQFVTSWEMKAPGDGDGHVPHGIVIDSAGTVYVADAFENRILKFSTSGNYLGTIEGSGEFVMKDPESLALDRSGNLYVVDHDEGDWNIVNDNDDRFLRIAPDGSTTQRPGQPYDRAYDRIDGLTIGSDGRIYVSNSPNRLSPDEELLIHASSGSFEKSITADASGQLATGPDGTIYLLDKYNDRMIVFGPDGNQLNSWALTGPNNGVLFMPDGLAVGPDGSLFVSDYFSDNGVLKYSPTGTLLTHWGTKGTAPGSFDGPSFIATDSLGNVYVSDAYNNRIQKFAPAGAPQPAVTTPPTSPVILPPTGSTYAQARAYYVSGSTAWSNAWGASDFTLIRQYLTQAKTEFTSALTTANAVSDPANTANLALVRSVSTAYVALADAALAMYDGTDAYSAGQTQMNAANYAAAATSFQTAADRSDASKALFGQATTTLQSVVYTGTEYGDGSAYTAVIVPILNGKAQYVGDYANYARAWQHTALAFQATAAGNQATFRSEGTQAMNLFAGLRANPTFGADATTNYNILVGLLA